MIIKKIITKGKKVKLQTIDTKSGKTRTYPLGKSDVFTNVKITKEGFRASGIARDGNLAVMKIIIDRKGKMVGVTINHPKVDLNIIDTKNEVTISVKKK